MSEPISIEQIRARIVAQPAPLLFLDTCALLDVLRVASERETAPDRLVAAAEKIALKAGSSPPELWVVSGAILDVEWGDNKQSVFDSVTAHIARVDRSLVKLHAALRAVLPISETIGADDPATSVFPQVPQIGRFALPERLVEICEKVLASVVRLHPDAEIQQAAYSRSMKGLKPAAIGKREHPDCQIIETCFALCRALRSSGFSKASVFVSSNRRDFYGEGRPLRPHEDMAGECSAVDLSFAVALDHALSILLAPGAGQASS
jgi:hypothetical protein